jgi:hypothetical protein
MSARWHTRHRGSITGAGPPPFPFVKLGVSRPLTDGDWTIYPDETGTRFINDRTGQGMFVSIENVYIVLIRNIRLAGTEPAQRRATGVIQSNADGIRPPVTNL